MKKFNGFEKYLLEQGLNMVMEQMKIDIRQAEAKGKNALMTEGYVDMIGRETLEKLVSLTKKQKS
tara:strand:+ start:2371 stop:2565 length:195 start_codon:yes stop_codon:yes gene_type:complete